MSATRNRPALAAARIYHPARPFFVLLERLRADGFDLIAAGEAEQGLAKIDEIAALPKPADASPLARAVIRNLKNIYMLELLELALQRRAAEIRQRECDRLRRARRAP